MSTPAIPFVWGGGGGKCPLMPFFMGGQMSGRAFVHIPCNICLFIVGKLK